MGNTLNKREERVIIYYECCYSPRFLTPKRSLNLKRTILIKLKTVRLTHVSSFPFTTRKMIFTDFIIVSEITFTNTC